jgi:small subunit ribosomal protein S17
MAEQAPQQATQQASEPNKQRKVGQVVSTKMAKTIVVEVTRRVSHPVYKRIVQRRKKFYAHDEQQTAKPGDIVRIVESRPLSKLKRWALDGVVRRAVQVDEIEAPKPAAPGGAKAAAKKKKKK